MRRPVPHPADRRPGGDRIGGPQDRAAGQPEQPRHPGRKRHEHDERGEEPDESLTKKLGHHHTSLTMV